MASNHQKHLCTELAAPSFVVVSCMVWLLGSFRDWYHRRYELPFDRTNDTNVGGLQNLADLLNFIVFGGQCLCMVVAVILLIKLYERITTRLSTQKIHLAIISAILAAWAIPPLTNYLVAFSRDMNLLS